MFTRTRVLPFEGEGRRAQVGERPTHPLLGKEVPMKSDLYANYSANFTP